MRRFLLKAILAPVVVAGVTTAIASGIGAAAGVHYLHSKKDDCMDKVNKCKEAVEKVKEVFDKN